MERDEDDDDDDDGNHDRDGVEREMVKMTMIVMERKQDIKERGGEIDDDDDYHDIDGEKARD